MTTYRLLIQTVSKRRHVTIAKVNADTIQAALLRFAAYFMDTRETWDIPEDGFLTLQVKDPDGFWREVKDLRKGVGSLYE